MSDSEDFKFNLDTRDAVSSAMNLKDTIMSVGDSKNLSGLIGAFTSLAGPVALAGAGIFAIKTAIDFAKEGEQIERINHQFDELARSSGQSATVLKEKLEKATDGMIDMEDAMKSANKVMYDMGPNAAKIPAMFELARKAGKVYGGETTENFEKISQAIVNGNTRMLRSIGLKVDAETVEKKYATSIGKTVQTLTAMEKQTALLNAVMEKGNEKFKSISSSGETVGGMLKQITVGFKEFGDMVSVAAGKSDFVKNMVRGWRDGFASLNEYMRGTFGTEFEKSQKHVGDLSDKLRDLKGKMADIQLGDQGIMSKLFGMNEDELKQQIAAAENDYRKAAADHAKFTEEENAKKVSEQNAASEELSKSGRGGPTPEELQKQKQAEAAFQKELLGLKESRLAAEMEIETNAEKYHDDLVMQREFTEQQYTAKIDELRAKSAQGDTYSAKQAADEIAQIEAEKAAKIEKINNDMSENQLKVYDNQVSHAKTASGGIAAAFAQGSARAKKDNQDFGKQGQQIFGSLKTNAVSAFKAMGDGSKSAGDAIKGFLLNSVADYFEMKGEGMLLEGIWPPNPAALAAGGGLIALSAAMRSAAGSAGGSSSSAGGGGGSGGGGGFGPTSSDISSSKPTPEEQKKKSVTIQVQGNYFETEQSKQRMLEMIRENTDATDFKYQQIGVG